MSKRLRIRQVRSGINAKENHKRTIRALGIRRMQQEVILRASELQAQGPVARLLLDLLLGRAG